MPEEFRKLVRGEIVVGLAVVFKPLGMPHYSEWILLCFHCLLQPTGGGALLREDLVIFSEAERARFGEAYGLLRVRKPNTQQRPATRQCSS